MQWHMGVYGHGKRVGTESGLWVKSSLPHRRIEPASALCHSEGLPIELDPQPYLDVDVTADTVLLVRMFADTVSSDVPADIVLLVC